MSNYNKNIYILTDILGYSEVEPGSPAGLDTTRVKDKFRQQTGNYWTQYQGSLPEYGDAESTIARDNPRRKVDRLRIIPVEPVCLHALLYLLFLFLKLRVIRRFLSSCFWICVVISLCSTFHIRGALFLSKGTIFLPLPKFN